MDDNYIDQYGDDNRSARSDKSDPYYIPLVMGILSFICFAVYTWSAFHARSAAMCVILFVPVFSLIGMVFSYTTRRVREKHFAIWLMGSICCVLCFILINLLFLGNMLALAQD